MTTYRKFDRFRAHSAFATDEHNFVSQTANLLIGTGTGTPASAYAANGGYNLVTSAAIADSAVVQRGIVTAATKVVSIPIRKGRKLSAICRFEHADFLNMDVNFGLGPAVTDPFTGTGSAYMSLKSDGTYSCVFGAKSFTGALSMVNKRDAWSGLDCEIYFGGDGKVGFFVNGERIGGFRGLTFNASTGLSDDLGNPLALSAGIVTRSATAKTVTMRRLASAVQIAPYPKGSGIV